ncbi:hypothetical protein [Corynebacterium sp.]|uniref:hypothetical protein n=1 Tax=Corynebacterium sp. TaxID=1720 RepID=UPI0028B17004|nr:hypothetical protein [Corynebacterium sp.]
MTTLPSLRDQRLRQREAEKIAETVIFETQIRPRVSPEIIEEHRTSPIGHHSDALERVLIYLRKHHNTMEGKYMLICTVPHVEWRVARNTGVKGEPPVLLDEKYSDRHEAEHGIFLRRLRDNNLIDDPSRKD